MMKNLAVIYTEHIKHSPSFSHLERPQRVSAVYNFLNDKIFFNNIDLIKPDEAIKEEILLVYSEEHYKFVVESMNKGKSLFDCGETYIVKDSLKDALLSADSAITAVNLVWMNGCLKFFHNTMIQSILSLALFISFISFSFTSAQVYPNPKVDSLLKSGIDNIINQNYDLAKRDFVILEKDFPNLPLGKIYFAAVEIAKSYDLDVSFNTKIIKTKLEEAKEISEALIDKDESNIWNYYFLALANGYEAYFNALNGDWLSAFGSGVVSVNLFEKCISINPDFYEALIAIGTYKYWKSKEMEFLDWIPFVEDQREEGIIMLEKAVKNSSYNSYLAINSLIWIYIDKGDYKKSVKLSQSVLSNYPKCRFFKFGLARALENVDLRESIKEYYNILNSYSDSEKKNRCNEIMIKHKIAQQYEKLGERQSVLKLCNEILNLKNLSQYERQKMDDRLERVKTLKNEISKGN